MSPNRVLVRANTSHQGRDSVFSLAIGISGLSQAAFGTSFPYFDYNIGHTNTDFTNVAITFLNRSVEELELDELDTLQRYFYLINSDISYIPIFCLFAFFLSLLFSVSVHNIVFQV